MKKIIALMLALAMCFPFALSGCKKNNDKGHVSTQREETEPMVFGIDGADGVFSPFFATAAYDTEITGQTQLGMLASDGTDYVYGDDEACVVKDLDITYIDSSNKETNSASKAQYTRYDMLIKKGIKFSDGVELTIKDVLFNLYVYLDPVYTGSATIYSTDIVGLEQYRTQSLDAGASEALENTVTINSEERLNRIYNWLNNQYLLQEYGSVENIPGSVSPGYDASVEGFEKEIQEDIEFFLPEYEQEIALNYKSVQSSFEEDCKNYAYDEGEYWESYLFMYGLINRKKNAKGEYEKDEKGRWMLDIDGDGMGGEGSKWVKEDIESYVEENWQNAAGESEEEQRDNAKMERAIAIVYETTVGSEGENGQFNWEYLAFANTIVSSSSTNTLLTQIQASERSKALKELQENGEGATRSVSGITTQKVTKFRNEKEKKYYNLDGEYDVLSITINKIDPKAIWNFAFTVAPLHYYSYEGAGNEGEWNVNNNFGVKYGDSEFFTDVLKESEKLGVPVGAGAYKASKLGGLGDQKYPKKNEFKRNNIVYYERNTYFDTVDEQLDGGPIRNARVKYMQYKITNSNFLLDSLINKEIDVGTPNATQANTERVNQYRDFLTSKTVLTSGYGYVGVNAAHVPDVWMRRAIMKAMDTTIISSGYYNGGLCELIYRPMSTQSWAYPKDAKTTFSFTDDSGEFVDYAYDATGMEIVKMLAAHGYEVSSDNTKVLKTPEGEAADAKEITFTIAGETNDHPAWQMFKNAEEILEKIGFNISVKTDAFALTKLASGQLSVWAAAWSSAIDPDMYQVYHKDSTATSTLNWGYRAIKQDKSKYAYEWELIGELSDIIDEARTSTDNSEYGTRAQKYWKALDIVMELAVEMPTYQRNDMMVFNSTKIDSSTLNQTPTAFDGLFSEIWNVGYVN